MLDVRCWDVAVLTIDFDGNLERGKTRGWIMLDSLGTLRWIRKREGRVECWVWRCLCLVLGPWYGDLRVGVLDRWLGWKGRGR